MKGTITNWGIQEVEALDGAPKMVIYFNTDAGVRRWESFFFKKDGDTNKKTFDTLATCGFTGRDLTVLSECDHKSLDMGKEFDLEIVEENGFEKVAWVNDPNRQAATFGLKDKKKLAGMKINKALNEALAKAGVKDGAKQAGPSGIDAGEELPF